MTHAARTIGWIGALVLSLVALIAAGDQLSSPAALDPGAVWTWLRQTDPAITAFSLLRVAAIVIVAYLLVSTLVLVAAQATRARVLISAASRITLPTARQLIRHAIGTGLALSVATSTAPAIAHAAPPPATAPPSTLVTTSEPVLHVLDDHLVLVHLGPVPDASAPAGTATTTTRAPTSTRPDKPAPSTTAASTTPVTPRRPPPGPMTTPADADQPRPTTPPTTAPSTTAPSTTAAEPQRDAPTTAPAPAPTPTSGSPGPPGAPTATEPTTTDATTSPATTSRGGSAAGTAPLDAPPPGTIAEDQAAFTIATTHHVIETGDHLWGVAARTLAVAWGADAEPSEIAGYLQRLIDTNRAVLAIPDDPDLVFPGQVFALPPVPAR
jgi:hypothetical protein